MASHDTIHPFAATFPLPFRVLFLLGTTLVGWATNLHVLEYFNIDAPTVLELRTPGSTFKSFLPVAPQTPTPFKLFDSGKLSAPLWHTLYRICTVYAIWYSLAWMLFQLATEGNAALVDVFRYLPAIAGLGTLTVVVCPFDVLFKRERDMLLSTAIRCINAPHVYFSDVIFADIATSLAKVLGDTWLSIYMLLPGSSLLSLPPQTGLYRWILPTIMSLPYFIRFRQCMIEHASERSNNKRPFYNAIKYASSFPVIFLSAGLRMPDDDYTDDESASAFLFYLWLFAAAVNTIYSFWWDVTNDWGLDLLSLRKRKPLPGGGYAPLTPATANLLKTPTSAEAFSPSSRTSGRDSLSAQQAAPPVKSTQYSWGLRDVLLYPLPVYPLVIFLNLVLRFTWSVKLSSHLHSQVTEGSEVIFWLEMGELVRRWLWVFLRVEWEVVKSGNAASGGYREEEYELVQDEN